MYFLKLKFIFTESKIAFYSWWNLLCIWARLSPFYGLFPLYLGCLSIFISIDYVSPFYLINQYA